jgi:hypothetical protein
VGKYGTRYGASLRKQMKKVEVSQHAKYTCAFCGKVFCPFPSSLLRLACHYLFFSWFYRSPALLQSHFLWFLSFYHCPRETASSILRVALLLLV